MITEQAGSDARPTPHLSPPPPPPPLEPLTSNGRAGHLFQLPAASPQARQTVLQGSLACAAVGGASGAVLAIARGRPLLWSMGSLAVNAGVLSFTFLGTAVSLSSAAPSLLPDSSVRAQMLAGALTGAVATGLQRAGRGDVSSAAEALRAGGRGLLTGALLGAAIWAARRLLGGRARSGEAEAEQRPAAGGDSGTSRWLPFRVSTAADLERDAAMKERRRQKARELSERRSATAETSSYR